MKPYGTNGIEEDCESIFLLFEEYESLRLCDSEMLNHLEASQIMQVSRPTLTRIYARARKKIADALVHGKQIIIEGGKVYFDSEWYACADCGCLFNQVIKSEKPKVCGLCGSKHISNCGLTATDEVQNSSGCNNLFVCPKCGYEKICRSLTPCKAEPCPHCQITMVRIENYVPIEK
jgi:predicted DNA-binding protein (UPF0251 family)